MIAVLLIVVASAQYIILQQLDGRMVHVNTAQIVSVGDAKQGGVTTDGSQCVISMTDQKFLSVAETCDSIRRRLEDLRAR